MNLLRRWTEQANRAVFFFVALLFHLFLFLIVATIVIFQAPQPPKEDFSKTYVPSAPPPPPPPQTTPQTISVSSTPVPTTEAVISSPSAGASFSVPMPQIDTSIDPSIQQNMIKTLPPQVNNLQARLTAIRTTVTSWRSEENIRDAAGDVHNLVAKFPVYLAQYADGDWDCNNYFNDPDKSDTATSGCLANLVDKIGEWSHRDLLGASVKSIAVDSPDLISSPPPYIFFTGHKDFHLSDDEITNLRKYLQAGGAIWGDDAFSGYGSRFDVAFHREMRKVLPDPDIKFETLGTDHPIFTKSWFHVAKAPKGMNYRQDPLQIINLDGKLAIIYTPNDYSDMMTAALVPGVDEDSAAFNQYNGYSADHPLYTPWWFTWSAASFYRNYTPASSMAVFKLSMNILTHLLIRFDDDLLLSH